MFRQIIIILTAFVIFLVIYVKYLEIRGVYYPMKEIEFTPADIGLKYEDVFFTTADQLRLNGWFIPVEKSRGTLLFCHGNAGNISHRLDKIIILHKLQLNIFVIDYRGYGRSQGRPSEKGLYLDARAAYDYLVKQRKISPEEIILYGESLGSAAVIDLAAEQKIGALILEGAFSRGKEMAKRIYPFLPAFLFVNSFDNLAKIKKISAPKLFIHSKNDEIVAIDLARKLYAQAAAPKHFAELFGGHNTAFLDSQSEYVSALESFLTQPR